MNSEGQPERVEQVGKVFDDTVMGRLRCYWFTGGFGAGVLGVGAIYRFGIDAPPVGVALLGAGILFLLMTAKKRGDWDV